MKNKNAKTYNTIDVVEYKGETYYFNVNDFEGRRSPHIHIFTENRKRDICLDLLNPRYFNHGCHNDKLTDDEVDFVYNWMIKKDQEEIDLDGEESAWFQWYACLVIYLSDTKNTFTWKEIPRKSRFNSLSCIPNYQKLKKG